MPKGNQSRKGNPVNSIFEAKETKPKETKA